MRQLGPESGAVPVGGEEDGGDVDERKAEESEPDRRLRVSHRPHLAVGVQVLGFRV